MAKTKLNTVALDWKEVYYTNCPLVSASNVDQELGWTREEYKKIGVKYAFLLGVIILFVTMIPLIGTVITATMMTIVALIGVSPTAALIVGITMLVYMQIEAYVLTPRVMGKAVQIPGSVVLISALAGGTLLGLLGALVAIPISAGILLILKQVVIPERELH